MILSKDIKPNKKIYYLGGKVLEYISTSTHEKNDILDIFQNIREKENISFSLFILSLDWLFLLGAVKTEQGAIIKCF